MQYSIRAINFITVLCDVERSKRCVCHLKGGEKWRSVLAYAIIKVPSSFFPSWFLCVWPPLSCRRYWSTASSSWLVFSLLILFRLLLCICKWSPSWSLWCCNLVLGVGLPYGPLAQILIYFFGYLYCVPSFCFGTFCLSCQCSFGCRSCRSVCRLHSLICSPLAFQCCGKDRSLGISVIWVLCNLVILPQ